MPDPSQGTDEGLTAPLQPIEDSDESSSLSSLPTTPLAPGSNEWPTLEEAMESVVRITLAGLGGSMLGLSQERKFESMRVVTGAAGTAAARRKRAPSSTQLANVPLTWAISCMAFCGLIETSRRLAPSSRIMAAIFNDGNDDTSTDSTGWSLSLDPSIQSFVGIVADFTFGGAVGGFAASMGRNTHLRRRLPSSMLRGSQRFFGVVPGIALGFVAGVVQAMTDAGIAYLENKQQQEQAKNQPKTMTDDSK